ncbi:MAG: GDSL-type esterase/lipase family protein [Bacteroidota bacterium]|nr:GDSL-type esterase/lipase family protein [Bacteroidota bacterium]
MNLKFTRSSLLIFLFGLLIQFVSCKKGDDDGYESYRYELWKKCISNNYTIDFLGMQYDDGNYPDFNGFSFDRDHEGIGGIETEGVLDNIDEVLQQVNDFNIVLLCIGGNDLLNGIDDPQTAIDNIHLIIDAIQNAHPDVTIFIEKIAPGNNEIMTPEFQLKLDEFNQLIAALAPIQTNANSNVIVVDMYTGFTENLLADDVHYNQEGALFIAERYFNAISSSFSSNATLNILPLGDSRVEGARP